jgi:hypothetical protein
MTTAPDRQAADARERPAPLTLREKALYHQIHPAKLATDILTEPVSLYLLWRHELILGLVAHFGPPILASILVIRLADLTPLKASALGRYIARHMTRTVEAARLAGDLIMFAGAWLRSPWVIALGLAVVIAAWLSGRVIGRGPSAEPIG